MSTTLSSGLGTTVGGQSFTFSAPNGAIVHVVKTIDPEGEFFGGTWLLRISRVTPSSGQDRAFSPQHTFGDVMVSGEHRQNTIVLPACEEAHFICLVAPTINGQPASTSAAYVELP